MSSDIKKGFAYFYLILPILLTIEFLKGAPDYLLPIGVFSLAIGVLLRDNIRTHERLDQILAAIKEKKEQYHQCIVFHFCAMTLVKIYFVISDSETRKSIHGQLLQDMDSRDKKYYSFDVRNSYMCPIFSIPWQFSS